MITVEDFKILMNLDTRLFGKYHIFIYGEEIDGLTYDADPYQDEIRPELRCTFVFVKDKYILSHRLDDYKNADWTVKQMINVDWRNL